MARSIAASLLFIIFRDVVELLEKLTVNLSDTEKDDIFYNNAKKFYNIDQ